jgi:hypothetical protein
MTQVETQSCAAGKNTGKDSRVTAALKQMATVLRNMRTYQGNNPVLQKSFDYLLEHMTTYLKQNDSLTLLVREDELIYGRTRVYSCDDKLDSLAFALYRDGLRLISFRDGLARAELLDFMDAIHEAREADPYQADLVTILWEKDLANITYRAVDAYLDDDEKKSIEEMQQKQQSQEVADPAEGEKPDEEFFVKGMGLSLKQRAIGRRHIHKPLRDADVRRVSDEIIQEDNQAILKRCSDICLEILRLTPRDDTFDRLTDFLGRICDWQVSTGDFLSACSIVSDLRSLGDRDDMPPQRRRSTMDTIAKLGERRTVAKIGEQLVDVTDGTIEEVFAFLALMSEAAVEPLCEILAECEIRKVRYLLCRAISVIAKNDPKRIGKFIHDQRWFFVRNIVMILGMMGNPEAIGLLRQAASHAEDRVRREVARSVGRLRSSEGLDILQTLACDKNKMIRMASFAAMREVDATAAKDFLEALITDQNLGKKGKDEKRELMRTYGGIGDQGLEFLENVVCGAYSYMDEETRASALYGVAMINGEDAVQLMRQVVDECDGVMKSAAIEALQTIEGSSVGGNLM